MKQLKVPEAYPWLIWRFWEVGRDGSLLSHSENCYRHRRGLVEWPTKSPLRAECRPVEGLPCRPWAEFASPNLECKCGIWGSLDPFGLDGQWLTPHPIFGLAAMWGRVVVEDDGQLVRAEFARPVIVGPWEGLVRVGRDLESPDFDRRAAAKVAARYQIPVAPSAKALVARAPIGH